MADLLQNVGCQSRGLGLSDLSPPAASSRLSVPLLASRWPVTPPHFSSDFAKISALIPHAVMHAQERSSSTEHGIKWWEGDSGAVIGDVRSAQELLAIIENDVGKLVVVEFFAPWCGSCRALYPKLCKLAREHQDIVIVKVNFDENKAFCKSMNVKVLPYFHFYRGNLDQIDAFSCSILKLQKLKDAIAKYKDGDYSADEQGPVLLHQT